MIARKMKASLIAKLAVLVALTSWAWTGTPASAQGQELLSNPGFEEGLPPWYGQSASTVTQSTYVNSGNSAVYVANRQFTYGAAAQKITDILKSTGNGGYTFSGYLRAAAGQSPLSAKLVLRYDDDKGPHWLTSDAVQINDSGFTKVTATWNISWSGTLTNATVYFDTPNSTAALYADDFSFTQQSGSTAWLDGPELLNNPGMENGLTGWTAYSSQIAQESAIVHSGSKSVKVYGRTAVWGSALQDITQVLKTNGRGQYTFGGFIKMAQGSSSAVITIKIQGDKDASPKWFTLPSRTIASDSFTALSGSKILSWNGQLKSAALYVQTDGTNMTDLYMDDFSLKKSEVNLALGKTYSASGSSDGYEPDKAFDGSTSTRWEGSGAFSDNWLEVNFGQSTSFSKVVLNEYGNRAESYRIEYWDGAAWQTAFTGTTIGESAKEIYFPMVTGSKARIRFLSGQSVPSIAEFAVYTFDGSVPDTAPVVPIKPPAPDPSLWNPKPLVGAIRWDAWTGIGVGDQVEQTLGPSKYHFRLPYFANIIDDNHVEIVGTTQAIMDQEIQYAKQAGIDYWAFCYYPSTDSSDMDKARELYLTSEYKHLINWTLIMSVNGFNLNTELPWLIERFKESNFQTVLNGRPLLYLYTPTAADMAAVNRIRTETVAAGVPTPYIVALGIDPSIADVAEAIGADAISFYTTSMTNGAPYASLTDREWKRWEKYKATGKQVVPTVTTGWDKRPRHDHPVTWEGQSLPTEWTQQATPQEIADHLQEAIQWNDANRNSAIANTVLMYAWNEHDEGGWLSPTLFELRDHGAPLRLNALESLLRPENETLTLVSQGKSATASTTDSLPASAAFDGDESTGWTSVNGQLPQWLQVDLGRPYQLKKITQQFHNSDNWAYKLEGSLNGQQWTVLSDHSANPVSGSQFDDTVYGSSRYVRMKVTGSSQAVASSKELKVYAELSSEAFVRSVPYTIYEQDRIIDDVPEGISPSDFLAHIVPSANAVLTLLQADGMTPVTSGTLQNGMKLAVTSEDQSTTSIYRIQTVPLKGQNLALDATVNVSSVQSSFYAGKYLNDGNNDTLPFTGWAASQLPAWVELDFGTDKTFNRVDLYTKKYYEQKEYTLQYWNGETWTDITTVTGNTADYRASLFPEVTASKLRVWMMEGNVLQNDTARLNELEVYRMPGGRLIEQIGISGEGGVTVIDSPEAALQMVAVIGPAGVSDPRVNWTVTAEDGSSTDLAGISPGGLLSAKGNGVVKVTATARDGSAVKGGALITITNQGKPPITSASLSPVAPDGQNGWYVHPVTVTLSVNDNQSGVAKTEYSLDGGSAWQSYAAPVTNTQDGKYMVSYRSDDNAGNVEAVKSIGFNLDATGPTITVSDLAEGTYNDSMDITPILTLSDNLSGVDGSKTTVTLDTYSIEKGVTIPLYTLPLGHHTFIITSSDLAGNTNTRTIVFQTTTSIKSMQSLVTRFTKAGWINKNFANSLQDKLAANDLSDFVSIVKAQSGKLITSQTAGYLLRDAQHLLSQQ